MLKILIDTLIQVKIFFQIENSTNICLKCRKKKIIENIDNILANDFADVTRKKEIILKFFSLWSYQKNLRFCQMLSILLHDFDNDIFYIEDKILIEKLDQKLSDVIKSSNNKEGRENV